MRTIFNILEDYDFKKDGYDNRYILISKNISLNIIIYKDPKDNLIYYTAGRSIHRNIRIPHKVYDSVINTDVKDFEKELEFFFNKKIRRKKINFLNQ